jgi:hypothetical protein
MTTLAEGQMKLSKLLMERSCAGLTTELAQVDAVLCEDFAAVHVWFYFRDGGDALIGVDLSAAIDPASFDPDGFVGALMELPSLAMH